MPNPYENVQIGNFLIALGYALRDLNRSLFGSINLFQQTPKDSVLGDVFGVLNGKYFILEFKRSQKHLSDELDKLSTTEFKRLIKISGSAAIDVSVKSHLMIYGSFDEENILRYRSQPYLKAIFPEDNSFSNPHVHLSSPEKFVDEIYSNNCKLGCSIKNIKAYVAMLMRCTNSNTGTGGGRNVSGLMVCADPERKEIQAYQFEDLSELHLALELRLGKSIAKEISKNKGISKGGGMNI